MTKSYRTVLGDMWDTISYKVFGTGDYTDQLMRYNAKYREIVVFSAGVVLEIPDISEDFVAELPPWKRQ